jgi:hypothetical protein
MFVASTARVRCFVVIDIIVIVIVIGIVVSVGCRP